MPDGPAHESPPPGSEVDPSIYSVNETAAVDNRAVELVGRPGINRFKDTDGNIIMVRTNYSISLRGKRHKGNLLPRRHDLLVEVKDKNDIRHPDDPTRIVTPFEQVFIDIEKDRSGVRVSRGYYDGVLQTITDQDVREPKTQRLDRIKRLEDLLARLGPDRLINRFERTQAEAEKDRELAEKVRKKIDTLLQLGRDHDGLIEDGMKGRYAQFQEDDANVVNVTVERHPDAGDYIFIIDPAVTPKQPDKAAEIPQLRYLVPRTGYPDQRVIMKSVIQHIAADGTRLPLTDNTPLAEPTKHDFANEHEVHALLGRLGGLNELHLRIPPPTQS
jgi:hypothetical protein